MGSQGGNDLVQQHGMGLVAGFQHHVGRGIDRLAHRQQPLQGPAHVVIGQQGAGLVVSSWRLRTRPSRISTGAFSQMVKAVSFIAARVVSSI